MVFVIAEVGVNHNGDIDEAHRLVDVALAAGADAVKFQAFTPKRLDPPGPRRDMLSLLKLNKFQLNDLAEYCEGAGIEFMATPFDVEWLEWLVSVGIKRIKISSGSSSDSGLIAAAERTGLPVILSTGMTSEPELVVAVCLLRTAHLTLMHCVSAYPTKPEILNLRRISSLKSTFSSFGVSVGLSDHSTSIFPAVAAVALGASVIEKHITLDQKASGPDHASSLEPKKFARMVRAIREVEASMGDGKLFGCIADPAVLAAKKERDEWRNSSLVLARTVV